MSCERPLVAVTGPTAAGKTSLAIELAEKLGKAEIISVDSRQVRRYMDIGTAKPNGAQQARVSHHCLDLVDPDQPYSAGAYGSQARRVIRHLWQAGVVPLLVGGSGLYLQAVLDGLFPDDQGTGARARVVRQYLRRRLATEGAEALHAELGRRDPVAQARIQPADGVRTVRALEVAAGAGSRRGQVQDQPLECLPLMFCLYASRPYLYQRIDQRVDSMVAAGLGAEVEALRARGYGRGCPAFGPMGYEEILDFVEGRCTLEQAKNLVKQRSRHYAKRQLTWFRRDRRLRWLDLDRWGSAGCLARILAQVSRECEGLSFAVDSGR